MGWLLGTQCIRESGGRGEGGIIIYSARLEKTHNCVSQCTKAWLAGEANRNHF